jgi:hypothetical protein
MRKYIVTGLTKLNNPNTVIIVFIQAPDKYEARISALLFMGCITDVLDITHPDREAFIIYREH